MTAMNKLTTTYETTREFDEKGNVTHEIHTETREEPDCASYTVTTSTTSDEDIAEMLDGLIELQEPTPSILDIITGAAGIASIIASKETIREYDADGKVVRETVTETTEDDDTMYFPPFQTYQETVKPWWGEPSCTCKTNS